MIIAKTKDNRKYNLAFTTAKEIPEEFIKNRLKPVKIKASVNKKETMIEIIDFLTIAFDGLSLLNMLIRTGTDMEAKEIQKGLIARFGNGIKRALIYIVSYKIIK